MLRLWGSNACANDKENGADGCQPGKEQERAWSAKGTPGTFLPSVGPFKISDG